MANFNDMFRAGNRLPLHMHSMDILTRGQDMHHSGVAALASPYWTDKEISRH